MGQIWWTIPNYPLNFDLCAAYGPLILYLLPGSVQRTNVHEFTVS
jgi:hypothetical protein